MNLRRLVLLILFILALVLISNYGGVVSYVFFYATVLVPLISLAYLFYVLLRFSVYQEIKTRNIVAGEPVSYSFILSNEWHIAFTAVAVGLFSDYSFVTDVPDHKEFTLFPGEKISFDTLLTCKYRGEYEVGVKKLIITDFLGIFRLSYKMPSTIEAIVKPRIVRLDVLKDVPEIEAFMQSHLKQDINEPDLTVRDYIPGDSLRRIHWKATARSGALKVRNEVGTVKQKLLLLADFERVSENMAVYLPLENQILTQTIALLYYFVRQNIPTEVFFLKDQPERRDISDISQFSQLYEELATLSFRVGNPFATLFQNIAASGLLARATIIFMVIKRLDSDLFTALSQLSSAGKIMVVYVIGDEDISDYIRQSNARLRITALKTG